MSNELAKQISYILYSSPEEDVKVMALVKDETIWLTQKAMAELFDCSTDNISLHLKNVFASGELEKKSVTEEISATASDGKNYRMNFYNLDAIISVGYRVKSQRGVEFRRWATRVLKEYIVRGYALNRERLKQLGQAVEVMKRVSNSLDTEQVLDVVKTYSSALDLLDGYDHQTIAKPKAKGRSVELTYEECRRFIDGMKFSADSALFGNEKDGSFKSALGAVYQSFGGKDLYPSAQEKAANLLYLVTKNHGFSDGNKRIAAGLFLYFLKRNRLLLRKDGSKRIADHTLVALTVMIAESKPAEKEMMVNLVMTFLA